jgi:hypothetical protein
VGKIARCTIWACICFGVANDGFGVFKEVMDTKAARLEFGKRIDIVEQNPFISSP